MMLVWEKGGDSRPAKSLPDSHPRRAPVVLPMVEGPMPEHGDRNAGGLAYSSPPFVPPSLTLYMRGHAVP